MFSSSVSSLSQPTTPIPTHPPLPPPRSLEDKHSSKMESSCFDILNSLRRRWFVRRDVVLASVRMATKDNNGKIIWVDFEPSFHQFLVKGAWSAVEGLSAQGNMVKRAMFVYILELLNNKAEINFFDLQHQASAVARANHEKKRIARKALRAAKREWMREEAKVQGLKASAVTPPLVKTGSKVICTQCGKGFKSRKTLNRHRKTCGTKPNKNAVALPVSGVSTLSTTTPVTVGLGSVVTTAYCGRGAHLIVGTPVKCDGCDNMSVSRKDDRWPKCLDCSPLNHRDESQLYGDRYDWISESIRLQWKTIVE